MILFAISAITPHDNTTVKFQKWGVGSQQLAMQGDPLHKFSFLPVKKVPPIGNNKLNLTINVNLAAANI